MQIHVKSRFSVRATKFEKNTQFDVYRVSDFFQILWHSEYFDFTKQIKYIPSDLRLNIRN